MEVKYAVPKDLEPHPLNLELVPEMVPEEFEALVEDVGEKGILQPVEVLAGTNLILDGRNRWKAAIELGVKVPYVEVDVSEEEVAFYILERVPTHRSLPPGVRAALAAEWVEAMKPNVKRGRPKKGAKNCTFFEDDSHHKKGGKNSIFFEDDPEAKKGGKNSTTIKTGRLREEAGKKFGVNDRYVQIAWNLKRLVPESFQLLKTGELSIQDAQGILSRARIEREIAFSYPVLLKRTHHEEANHHSQTHDPRGTKGLPEEARALAGRSGKVIGRYTWLNRPLGIWKKTNSPLSSCSTCLSRRKRNPLISSLLPINSVQVLTDTLYQTKGYNVLKDTMYEN